MELEKLNKQYQAEKATYETLKLDEKRLEWRGIGWHWIVFVAKLLGVYWARNQWPGYGTAESAVK